MNKYNYNKYPKLISLFIFIPKLLVTKRPYTVNRFIGIAMWLIIVKLRIKVLKTVPLN